MGRSAFVFLLMLASLASASGVDAQPPLVEAPEQAAHDEEARRLFEAGQLAFEDGRFADALDAFRRSFQLSQRPTLLYNIGLSADRLRADAVALDAFERFNRALPDSSHRRRVEARIEAIRSALERERREDLSPDRVAQDANTHAMPPPDAPPPQPSVWRSWWLWTVIGAVAAGTVVALTLAMRGPGVEAPLEGDVGFVVRTLGTR